MPATHHHHIVIAALAALLAAACGDGPTAPEPGILRIRASTQGEDRDEDGYSLTVDSEQLSISPDGTIHLPGISPGTHTVALEAVAENCVLQDTPTRSVTVESGEITDVVFTVTCDATGILISTSTRGPDHPVGHLVKSGERSAVVATTGSVLLSRLRPGAHTVSLTVAGNCTVASDPVATVNVANRAVTSVAFEIACARTEKSIVFVRDTLRAGNLFSSSILAASSNGSNIVRLADGYSPAWSPDGTRIAYSDANCDYHFYGLPCSGGLVIMDPETRSVSMPPSGSSGIDPSWSPDGKLIAFIRFAGFRATLVVIGSDGVGTFELASDAEARSPSWSPDGKRVVFGCYPTPNEAEICVVNSDGTGLKRLTIDSNPDGEPAWSPDGSMIAFQTTNRFTQGTTDIALMTPDGTGITWVTRGFGPAWLPDGSRLIFDREDGLFIIAPDRSNLTRLTTGRHRAPAWRP